MAEYLRNKKATFEYHLEDTYECGIKLLGTEVKSLKNHHGSLTGAYIAALDGGLYLLGAHIPAWQEKNAPLGFDPYQSRKLLVHKKELIELTRAAQTKGLTLIPVSLYGKGTLVKAQIAVAKGKKVFDKRHSIKSRDLDREARRGE